jgi:hypothetical protein
MVQNELFVGLWQPLHQCGIEDVKTFQRFLVGYQIHVISREHFNGIVYHGPTAEKKIYLYSFVIGGARWVSHWRRLVVEIKACWSFEVSSTLLTMYPIIFSLIVNLPTIMAYVSIARLVKIIIHLDTSVTCYLWITTIDRRNRLTSFSILNVPKMTGSSVNKDPNRMTTENVFIANHRGALLQACSSLVL